MKKHFLIFIYLLLIGYKRINLLAIAFAPLGIWAIGTGRMPNGFVRDEFIYQHQSLYILLGMIWFALYITFGLRFERFTIKILKKN